MRHFLYLFAFLLVLPAGLRAQNPGVNVCEASASPATVRAEGIAELAADIVVSCVNATVPGTPVTASSVVMNVFVRLGVDVTNNVNFGSGATISDAVLVVNENNCAAPAAVGGRFTGCGAPNPNVQDPQFGERPAADRLQWLSARVPVPSGPGVGGPNPNVTTLRLTSIRIRASQLGVPHAATIPTSPISATVNIAAQGFSLGENGTVAVAYPILGLMTSLPGGAQGELCRSGAVTVPIIVRENHAAALRPGGAPSFLPQQTSAESGYFGAAHPGRLLLRFSNIPQGVRLTLPKLVENGNPAVAGDALRLQWVDGAGANGAGGTVSSQTNELVFDSPSGGVAFAVYQVLDANPSILESASFPAVVAWTGGASLDTIRMSAYPGPLSTVTVADLAAPEPRFLDAAQPRNVFSIAPCSSGLLFPYVSNSGGESTRLILGNASGDVPGTTPQAGACTLSYRGDNAPADQTTAAIAPGAQIDLSLPTTAPGFAGFLLVTCNFEGGVGKAIVSRGGGVFFEADAEVIAQNTVAGPPEVRPLLFAAVAGAPGFDTRLVILNPGFSLPSVPERAGPCRLDYFGQNAPASQLTSPIPPGGRLAFNLSTGAPQAGVAPAPGFSGYVIATCELNSARGFAVISEHQNPALPPGSSPAVAAYGLAAEPFEAPIIVDPPEEQLPLPDPVSPLLLTYASARGGHDTRLVISNASLDALGTPPQAGTCTLDYRGDGAAPTPPPQTFALSAGEQARFRLSVGDPARNIAAAPGFRGYLALTCDFLRARAVASVLSPTGGAHAAAFAQPAEALRLPRNATPAPLLFPYVSNKPGEDRIVVLANTTSDPFGSTPGGGSCSLSYRGAGAPGPSSVPLLAGAVRAFRVSRGLPALGVPPAPGFQGYLLSVCDKGLIRAVDYRVAPDLALAPFCELNATPGVQPADVVALTALMGQIVPVSHPGDPDGDGVVTASDVQYCNSIAVGAQSGAPSDPSPPPAFDGLSAAADVRISFEASRTVARPQRPLTLFGTVTNAGPAAASNVAAILYPPETLLLSSTPSACTKDGAAWTCNLGTLAAGASVALPFSGDVSGGATSELAVVGQASSPTLDPDPANNAVRYAVPLETQADIVTSTYMLPAFPGPGDVATLTVSLTNRGPALAEDVRLDAQLDSAVELLQVPAGCSLSGQNLGCPIGVLSAGRTRAYLLQVRLLSTSSGPGGLSAPLATVSGGASTSEPEPNNNTSALPGFR